MQDIIPVVASSYTDYFQWGWIMMDFSVDFQGGYSTWAQCGGINNVFVNKTKSGQPNKRLSH